MVSLSDEDIRSRSFDYNIIKRFMPYVMVYKKDVFLGFFFIMLLTGASLLIPLVVKNLIDKSDCLVGASCQDIDQVKNSILIGLLQFLGLAVIVASSIFLSDSIIEKVGENILLDLRKKMFMHLQDVSISFMDKTDVGRLMSRLQGDVAAMQEALQTSVFAIGDFVLICGIITVLLSMNLQLGIMTLLVMPLMVIVRMFWLPRAREAFLDARVKSSAATSYLAENINGIRTIQSFNRQQFNSLVYENKANELLRAQLRASKFSSLMLPTVETLTGISFAIIIIVGASLVINDKITAGVMVAYMLLVQRFFDPIRTISMQYNSMQRAMASGYRIFEVLDIPVTIKDPKKPLDCPLDGSIKFDNVSFAYVEQNYILKDFNLTIENGERIGIVGPTGAGKSTISNLIHRFYDTNKGKVILGGVEIRKLSQEYIGKKVGMVLQDPFLFSGTILDNVKYGNKDVSLNDVEKATKELGMMDFINSLDDGFNTVIGQRGSDLSMGQRQLLSILRALVADTQYLILDEATSSIDSYTEKKIQKALDILLQNRTSITIAHRLATVRKCDKIIVLNAGKVEEIGSHEQLLGNQGLYSNLYNLNYSSFDD
ncbi:MAG: ABC transporter ATP-binding protein [SAR202 cluster bacterium]|nr:ABC transporter ATP-binding protein [Chloroflexota bacterium]MEC9107328.1 ABC transporter ATP-binding protein [Chloroflexota bacterium]MQF83706.1 ABC transporter ATP-binding protein [SAR202 cluster bacterium]MQG20290.1 ABC transporter ATP-binding protein [SAR202 cluster bacterium]MQG24230.1 ABC transporter ATP-binding protein [SAR202 cluster bacterium]|tara:strand:- start:1154 stop:2950 length:1797 start_codon:yes stop_codon:yes gene_type:complete